jgi:outer membrane protein assembly factor BamA
MLAYRSCLLSTLLLWLTAVQAVFAQEPKKEKISIGRIQLGTTKTNATLAKDTTLQAMDSTQEMDVSDLYHQLFKKNSKRIPKLKSSSTLTLLPSLGYTPSTGLEFGVDVSGSKYFGDPDKTTLSVFDVFGALSTNELAYIQMNHNVYTAENKWNIQGSWNLGKTVILDYGLGTGNQSREPDEIRYAYRRFAESFYRNVMPNLFVGFGISFNYYTKIVQKIPLPANGKVLNEQYSLDNSFSPDHYYANGLLLDLQYNTRDQPYRPFKGLFVDVSLKSNRKWLGSDQGATQLKTELRKYWGLSAKNPEQVLAYWFWGSYLLKGKLPYLDLSGTGSDVEQRMGRGYTIGRFKGPSYIYNELEYRFPITRNKLISGVAFLNLSTASDQQQVNLFRYWEPGTGAGIRILFDKHTRSNLCIDYGIGNYGSKGVFVGLNEVF